MSSLPSAVCLGREADPEGVVFRRGFGAWRGKPDTMEQRRRGRRRRAWGEDSFHAGGVWGGKLNDLVGRDWTSMVQKESMQRSQKENSFSSKRGSTKPSSGTQRGGEERMVKPGKNRGDLDGVFSPTF